MSPPTKARIIVEPDGLVYNSEHYHRVIGHPRNWCVRNDGIHIDGSATPLRTMGKPVTLQRIKDDFGHLAARYSYMRLIGALIATESGGNPRAERFEGKILDWSFGICQVLTKTATSLYARYHWLPKPPTAIRCDDDKSVEEWRVFFQDPSVSIDYAAAYITNLSECCSDPIMLYAMYNAGGAYESFSNPWGLRSAKGALDRFAAWYGDACEVFK